MSTNKFKKIWIATTEKYSFTIVATSKEECKELIAEISEGTITEDKESIQIMSIGHIAPTMDYFAKSWQGESFIVSSNFY